MSHQNEKHTNMQDALNRIDNRFNLSVFIAQRARQLQEGYKPLVDVDDPENIVPVQTALRELEQDKIQLILKSDNASEDEELDQLDLALEAEILEEEKLQQAKIQEKKSMRASKKSKSLLT